MPREDPLLLSVDLDPARDLFSLPVISVLFRNSWLQAQVKHQRKNNLEQELQHEYLEDCVQILPASSTPGKQYLTQDF